MQPLHPTKDRQGNPVARAAFGIILALAALLLLWRSEQRVFLADVAVRSQPASLTAVDPTRNGALVSVTGALSVNGPIDDGRFLEPGPYLQLSRHVEMFAWVETANTAGDRADVRYTQAWTPNPQPASSFLIPTDHANPLLLVAPFTATVASAAIGPYTLEPNGWRLPAGDAVTLTPNLLAEPALIVDNYIFLGDGAPSIPTVGDLRLRFTAVPLPEKATIFARQQGAALRPYIVDGDTAVYHLLPGSREDALATLRQQSQPQRWGYRFAAWFTLWVGLGLLVSPATGLLPARGSWLSRGTLALLASFLLAAFMIMVV